MSLAGTAESTATLTRPEGGSVAALPALESLVAKMREGDREAAARFVETYGPMIRRRVRGKLGPSMRRLFDSTEILSTVSRRLDRYVRAGRVRASTEPQLWTLVFKMVDAALVDRIRIMKRLKTVEGEDSDFARALLDRLEQAEGRGTEGIETEVDSALRLLSSTSDRQILSLWLMGNSLRVIADCVSMPPEGVRKRWQYIRERLRKSLQGEAD